MPQQRYAKLVHLQPEGYPKVYPANSQESRAIMAYLLDKVSSRWTKIPNYDMEVFATRPVNVPFVNFKKGGKEIYVHVLCNEFMNPLFPMRVVDDLYRKYKLGIPTFVPTEKNWLHSVALPGANLTAKENLLMHELTQHLFWTIFMDYKRFPPGKT